MANARQARNRLVIGDGLFFVALRDQVKHPSGLSPAGLRKGKS
jgi:hypothetical protein